MEHIFYGKSFSRPIGYKIMFEESPRDDHHHVGGDEWNLPNCRLCETPMHQLVCLDLKDDRLSELRGEHCEELVLFSCLNCSMLWEEQFFKLDFQNRLQLSSNKNRKSLKRLMTKIKYRLRCGMSRFRLSRWKLKIILLLKRGTMRFLQHSGPHILAAYLASLCSQKTSLI
ncbi:hypothetical protein CHCC20375_4280 [Bacillus licheniformis]|uniref:hypothetical protein n=1 Tax=Bacillus haynesii TaxID=1925021 RepID=UPI0012B7B60E|nr:hypothetical protein CHCC20375_4280 [Bacillus licheniformis]